MSYGKWIDVVKTRRKLRKRREYWRFDGWLTTKSTTEISAGCHTERLSLRSLRQLCELGYSGPTAHMRCAYRLTSAKYSFQRLSVLDPFLIQFASYEFRRIKHVCSSQKHMSSGLRRPLQGLILITHLKGEYILYSPYIL